MCGRYVLAAEPEVLQREFNLNSTPEIVPRFNIAPSQPVAIITNDSPAELTLVQWGLVPSWSKEPKTKFSMINARSETAAEKPSYRGPFKYRRCLIPASGFYEWARTDEGKQPHYIIVQDADVVSFAGLWEVWHGGDGDELWTCTILTTSATESIKHLHDRMPVILEGEGRDIWLDNESEKPALQALMQPFDSDRMAYYPVSKAVGNVRNDNPTLIEPFNPPEQASLL